jgi:excinuclease ABC subunit C
VGDHELAVRLRELELIRNWRPRFNSLGRPGRREIGYIYLTATEAPNFRFGRRVPRASRRCWGPLPITRRTRAAVQRLNHFFLLRDCPDRTTVRFREQLSLLPDERQPVCLRGQVGTCLAPCAGDRPQADYIASLTRACAFLDGRDRQIVKQYEQAMQQSASDQQYEQAASYRDCWQSLQALWDQLHLVRHASGQYGGVHVLRGCSGKTWWVLIAGGHVVRISRQPETPRAARQYLTLIERSLNGQHQAEAEDFEQMRIVASWYRQQRETREQILHLEEARDLCRRAMG